MIIAAKYTILALALIGGIKPMPAGTIPIYIPEPVQEKAAPLAVHHVWVTAYSSTPEETDDTPFITASGSEVGDGVIAANFLPFGTKVQIPDAFGDKIFVVKDRMHQRKVNFVDIWMPSKEAAIEFGITYAQILVLR